MLYGQATFHKTDFYSAGFLQYAGPASTGVGVTPRGVVDLYQVGTGGRVLGLVNQSLALSWAEGGALPATGRAKAGYIFDDIDDDAGGTAYESQIEFGVWLWPDSYDRSGRNSFVMDVGGTVYQQDPTTATAASAAYPSDVLTAWIAVGN